MHPHIVAQLEADRTAILSAIQGAGDPNAAHSAALHAHQRAQEAWHNLAGDTLYTAGATGGQHLAQNMQNAAPDANLPDYDPDDDNPDALTAWISATQDALGDGVHSHTGGMLGDALAAALLSATSGTHPTQPLANAVNDLYDQWTGQGSDGSDYSASVAGDWTAMGWNAGETDAAQQVTSGTDVGVQRTWTTVGDAKVRPEHAAADGQTVGMDEAFDVGGESLMFPADPSGSPALIANCRCILTYALSNGAQLDDSQVSDAESDAGGE